MTRGQTVILELRSDRELAKSLIDRAPNSAVVNIREKGRSTDQNAKLWAMLSDVSRSKPRGLTHSPDVWKCLFMNACGHQVQFVNGLDGEPFPVGFRSSKMNVAQMNDLITFIQQWGDENRVVWSNEVEVA